MQFTRMAANCYKRCKQSPQEKQKCVPAATSNRTQTVSLGDAKRIKELCGFQETDVRKMTAWFLGVLDHVNRQEEPSRDNGSHSFVNGDRNSKNHSL